MVDSPAGGDTLVDDDAEDVDDDVDDVDDVSLLGEWHDTLTSCSLAAVKPVINQSTESGGVAFVERANVRNEKN